MLVTNGEMLALRIIFQKLYSTEQISVHLAVSAFLQLFLFIRFFSTLSNVFYNFLNAILINLVKIFKFSDQQKGC